MNKHIASIPSIFPLYGVLASVILLVIASLGYPGGYDWIEVSVSSLFQPLALNGSPNSARLPAAVAVILCCTSLAIMFNTISKRAPTRFHQKTTHIAGIGSMVYTALLVTPMHDVLLGVALLFFVTAIAVLFHGLYLDRRWMMLGAGIVCLTLTLSNATMYFGDVLYGFLPIIQKASLVLWVAWLMRLYLTPGCSEPAGGKGGI